MTARFGLAVMVPTNRPWDPGSDTARQIQAAARAAGEEVRVIIIENGIPGLRPGREQVPGTGEVLRVEQGNKSAALNAGLAALDGEILVVFFDDDILLPPGIVAAYAQAARRWGPGHYFGGPTVARFEAPPTRAVARLLPDSARGLSYGDAPRRGKDFFLGFNWAAFSSDLALIGGFDPRFGPGSAIGATGQEATAQRRLRARGVRSVYVPECRVTHLVPPERCSEAFVLGRAAKNGTGLGLTAREDVAAAITLVPARAARHVLGLLASAWRPGEFGLALACRAAFWKGFFRGLGLG